ncbi:uncharacterized protein V6R79_006120 [Siganus canaliculatus]
MKMHPSNIHSRGQLERTVLSSAEWGCPLCPKFRSCRENTVQQHLDTHIKGAVHFHDTIICRCNLSCRDTGHFHCPFCDKTIVRKFDITSHLSWCQKSDGKQSSPVLPPSAPTSSSVPFPSLCTSEAAHSTDHEYVCSLPPTEAADAQCETVDLASSRVAKLKSVKCPHCSVVIYQKNLSTHINRKHPQQKDITAESHLQSVCVDEARGLFAVQKDGHGFSVPTHVQRKTWGKQHVTKCQLEDCRQYHMLAQRSGLSHSHCEHVRSLDYCSKIATEEPLQHKVLEEMLKHKFFGESKVEACKRRQKIAERAHAPLSVLVELGGSENQICLSIHEPKIFHFGCLGRVMVTYKKKQKAWHCPCAKARTSCPHKNIGKWHLFQTQRELFVTSSCSTETSKASCSHTAEKERSVRYVYQEKKIPTTLPGDVLTPRAYPVTLIPTETTCKVCAGNPELDNMQHITDKARIVGINGVIQNISTYSRRCTECHMTYHYQEWKDGLHNFNDHVILTLQLCLYLRHSLQNHVSVSRVMNSLEALWKAEFPRTNLILQAYCQFEALCDTKYIYSCVNCGFHPPVVIMDVHRKGVSNFEAGGLKKTNDDFQGEHNIEEFWKSVDLHMISRGFFEGSSKNPFLVKPSYDNWAPWIGRETRKSSSVLNTEFEKMPFQTSNGGAQLTEGHLMDELMKQKVSTLRKLCKSCNVETKGSRMDILNRLRDKMQSRHTYDKVQSIWGASGGWSVIMCPHGIVCSLKFNLRAESPRDFADLLLSWKHIPNVCVYDFACGLAAHANLRAPDNPPFQPHEGRLASPTKENIDAAVHQKLKVHLPWLVERMQHPEANGHPMTGSSQHYVLYNKFHQSNTKDPRDILRRMNVVPELQGSLTSQVAVQLFAALRKNNYFLNNMAPSSRIFLMRNIIEHRNKHTNEELLKRQLRQSLQVQQLNNMTVCGGLQQGVCFPVTGEHWD